MTTSDNQFITNSLHLNHFFKNEIAFSKVGIPIKETFLKQQLDKILQCDLFFG